MIYSPCPQGWYIGITAASQAVKAGSTPVPCSKKERHTIGVSLFFGFRETSKSTGASELPLRQGFAAQNACTAQMRRMVSTRRSASRLDPNYLTAEVNSAYNNSSLRCESTRGFARGFRKTSKCSGEVNPACAKVLLRKTLARRKCAARDRPRTVRQARSVRLSAHTRARRARRSRCSAADDRASRRSARGHRCRRA